MTDRPDETKLPPWLRGVQMPPRPADSREAAPTPQRSNEPAALSALTSPAAAAPIPSWLEGLSSTQDDSDDLPTLPPLTDESGALPDWLRTLGDASEVAPPTGTTQPIPDWLRESAATPDNTPVDELPSWLREGPPIEEVRPAATPPTESWLSGVSEPSPASQSAATLPTDEPVPDWLQSSADNNVPTSPAPPAQPAWAVPPPAAEPAATQGSDVDPDPDPDGLPNWLQSISDDDIRRVTESHDLDLGVAPFAFDGDPASPTPVQDIPSWLAQPDEPQRASGETTEWLGANASQLINAHEPPRSPEAPSWLGAATDDDDPTPDWLRGSEPPITSANDPTLPAGIRPSDIPAWLQSANQSASESDPREETSNQPSWLTAGSPTSAAQTVPHAPDASPIPEPTDDSAEVPAWLRDSDSNWSQPPAPTTPTPPAADQADVPAWLRDMDPAPPPAPLAAPVEAIQDSFGAVGSPQITPASDPELPAWLRDTAAPAAQPAADALPPWLRDETGAPMPTAMAAGDANLPAWLRGADATPASVPPAAVPPAPTPPATPVVQDFDWLSEPDTPAVAGSSELLGGADLPAWLRSETERPRETNQSDARSLDWLTRIGSYEDDAPAVVSGEASPRLSLPALPVRSAAQLEALSLLRQIASAGPGSTVAADPTIGTAARGQISIERIATVLLLILLMVGLAVPNLADPIPPAPMSSPVESAALLDQIKPLGEGDIVLIGYEWDAQRISELRPLERAVIDQLIEKHVKLVLVSTDPQGTMLQFDLRDRLNAAGYQGGGLDYVLLGYRPGGEIGLRQLGQNLRGALQSDFQGRDATIGALATNLTNNQPRLASLNDFAMAIVFADEPTDVQGWMEQIRPFMQRPIAFLVPAGVQPIAQPYFRQPGIYHLAGAQGALSYEQLRGSASVEQTAQQARQIQLATLIFAGMLLIGTLAILVQMLVTRRRSKP